MIAAPGIASPGIASPGGIDAADPGPAFREAMGHLAGAVTIVTAGRGDGRRGLTMTAVCSVTADPPTLLACVNRTAEAHDVIAATGAFCVNVLAAGDEALAGSFAARDGSKGVARFAGRDWAAFESGVPALADALVAVDCTVDRAVPAGSHTVFLGRVRAIRRGGARAPLLYYNRAFHSLG